MIDANIFLYAYHRESRSHEHARQWLEDAFQGPETIGIGWATVAAFLRLTTDARVFAQPISLDAAAAIVDEWVACPTVEMVGPTERHWSVFRRLLEDCGSGGNLVPDAHLAALVIEHGATLVSADKDFRRFEGLRFEYFSQNGGAKPER